MFSQYKSCDNTLENCFFQITFYSPAYLCGNYEEKKGQVPLGPLLGKQNIQAKEVYNITFTHEHFLIKSCMGPPMKRHFCYKKYVNILITPKEFLALTLENSLTNPEKFHCSSTWRGGGYSNAIAHWQLALLRFSIRLGVSLRGRSMSTAEIVRCIVNALIN